MVPPHLHLACDVLPCDSKELPIQGRTKDIKKQTSGLSSGEDSEADSSSVKLKPKQTGSDKPEENARIPQKCPAEKQKPSGGVHLEQKMPEREPHSVRQTTTQHKGATDETDQGAGKDHKDQHSSMTKHCEKLAPQDAQSSTDHSMTDVTELEDGSRQSDSTHSSDSKPRVDTQHEDMGQQRHELPCKRKPHGAATTQPQPRRSGASPRSRKKLAPPPQAQSSPDRPVNRTIGKV